MAFTDGPARRIGRGNYSINAPSSGAAIGKVLALVSGSENEWQSGFVDLLARPWSGRKWAALGTAITSQNYYPQRLAAMSGMVCTNLGVSGASASSSSTYLPSGFVSQIASIPLDCDLVTIELGANDFRGNAALGALGNLDLSTFYGAIYKTLKDVLDKDWTKTVIVFDMYPNTPADSYQQANYLATNNNGIRFWAFQNAIHEVCRWLGIPCIRVGSEAMIGGLTNAAYLEDGIHLSPGGAFRYASYINQQLIRYVPTQQTWSFRDGIVSDFSGFRCTPQSVNSSGVVQVSGLPETGTPWAALWLGVGATNAIEFEIAEPDKGIWFACGANLDGSAFFGFGDPKFDPGQVKYCAIFSALGAVFSSPQTLTNNLGVYPTRLRLARLNDCVFLQGFVTGKWLPLINFDLKQQSFAGVNIATEYAVKKLGIMIAGTGYSGVKNVRVGTLELS